MLRRNGPQVYFHSRKIVSFYTIFVFVEIFETQIWAADCSVWSVWQLLMQIYCDLPPPPPLILLFITIVGSSGPSSINPETGEPYGTTFPLVSVFDMVNSQFLLLDHLGIDRLYAAVGSSLGWCLLKCVLMLHVYVIVWPCRVHLCLASRYSW